MYTSYYPSNEKHNIPVHLELVQQFLSQIILIKVSLMPPKPRYVFQNYYELCSIIQRPSKALHQTLQANLWSCQHHTNFQIPWSSTCITQIIKKSHILASNKWKHPNTSIELSSNICYKSNTWSYKIPK